ncbi:MAG TPA: carbamoyltransferase HypF, partial [Fimbriimonadaceae bacterium]|nr:carbamoyltransferase HypF [Fimbriimonadaceae bacterium]
MRGLVQGVGFRPFVFGLATELGLKGYVTNSAQGAEIEIEGSPKDLDRFLARLPEELPSPGFVAGLETQIKEIRHFREFSIKPSQEGGSKTATMLPDIATCPKCLAEMSDSNDRRYRYPFINCTHCGPRYSILLRLPYDRPNTTMREFAMCEACRAEYEDPRDRRFHAQPIACPVCGPQIELWDPPGRVVAARGDALLQAAEMLRNGAILALKGIGGFHLMVDARNEVAVSRLRERKRRFAKPLAVMVPSLEAARQIAHLAPAEERLLRSPEAPIVLARSKGDRVAPAIAPENPNLGLMLPYSPLHHLLMEELGFPLVATSGNLSEEPICTDETEAVLRFHGIADALLVHDRPIARPVDDSVARVMLDRPTVLRRARGYAPLPIALEGATPGLIAVGAHLKNSVALSLEGAVVVGQHVGDLDNAASRDRMISEVEDLCDLHELSATAVCHDLHPDYASTRYAESLGLPLIPIQHHVAHAAACLAENGLDEALAIVWDGTGYGTDGTIWGGEF